MTTWFDGKTPYICLVDDLRVRSKPSTSSKILAWYNAGQIVWGMDSVVSKEGIVWGSYIADSGKRRYIAIRDKLSRERFMRPATESEMHPDKTRLQKFIDLMDYYCRVASVGYDQSNRWDVRNGGETDCSALVITCLKQAGFDTGYATYTGNLAINLCNHGWVKLDPDIVIARPGDILLNHTDHVAAVIKGYGWNATIAQASIDENGNISGGLAGDQTGFETNERPIYDYPWDCILRYSE